MQRNDILDVVGVGIGPFNLSVAALAAPLRDVRSWFVDTKPEFQWHGGLLFDDSVLQVSFLKDLVTLADPTSCFSFVSFLVATKRAYRFLNADFPRVSRREFDQYLRWVCSRLTNLQFSSPVHEVRLDNDAFCIETNRGCYKARNVVLGTGLTPTIPTCAIPHLGDTVFHAADYLTRAKFNPAGRRVAVIGGGQTGAEIVAHLINGKAGLPEAVHWISRRSNFLPLDESAFTNEFFGPAYCRYFHSLSQTHRDKLLREQYLASNGISDPLLQGIYRRLYELEFIEGHRRFINLAPRHELWSLTRSGEGWHVVARAAADSGSTGFASYLVDTVVLCTGWHYELPPFLQSLAPRLHWSERGFDVRLDFSILWDGPDSLRIFAQNAAHNTHGIAERNLSLMAWRSASIVNSLAGRMVYDVADDSSAFDWHCSSAGQTQKAANS